MLAALNLASTAMLGGEAYSLAALLSAGDSIASQLRQGACYRLVSTDPAHGWLAVLATVLADAKLICDPAAASTTDASAIEPFVAAGLTALQAPPREKRASEELARRLVAGLSSPEPRLALATSGSTGAPTMVWKSWQVLCGEALGLSDFYPWPADDRAGPLVSLVTPIHIYGLLHSLLLPLVTGRSIVQLSDVTLGPSPAEQAALSGQACALLVITPASWPRARELMTALPVAVLVSSAGAFGSQRQAQLRATASPELAAFEIYGSTETGGIAWQDLLAFAGFKAFSAVTLQLAPDGPATVHSPYIFPSGEAVLQDELEPWGKGFRVLGRRDQVFKYGGTRHSLSAVAQELARAADLPVERVVCDFQWGSDLPKGGVLWGFVELPELAGDVREKFLAEQGRKGTRLPFPDEILALPKLPRTPLGKVSLAALRQLRHRG